MPYKDPEKAREYRRSEPALARTRAWRKRNKKHIADYNSQYRKEHPDYFKDSRFTAIKKALRAQYLSDWYWWMENHGYKRPYLKPVKYDYHHRNGEVKLFNISEFIKGHPVTINNINVLQKELNKCDYMSAKEHSAITVSNATRTTNGRINKCGGNNARSNQLYRGSVEG